MYDKLQTVDDTPMIFEKEFDTNALRNQNPFPILWKLWTGLYVVEGPRIEKMLGYTNLESEKGFVFLPEIPTEHGNLDRLEEPGIQEGETVRIYGLEFDYYK